MYRETETQTEPYTPGIADHDRKEFPDVDTDYRPDVLALSSLKYGSGLPPETEFDVERVQSLVRLQQEEQRIEHLESKEKEVRRQEVLNERQELEWRARQEKVADSKGHRESALDGYIKVIDLNRIRVI